MMGGALFRNHPSGALQFQDATVRIEDPTAPGDRRGPGRLGAQRRVVQLHRRAARQGARPRHARREHLRRAGRLRRGGRPPDRVVLHLRRRAPLLHRARPPRRATGASRSTASTSSAPSSGPRAQAQGDCGEPREGLPTDASFDKVTLDDNTENPMEIAVAARRHRLQRRARRHASSATARRTAASRLRHDPRPPRQRERPARDHARPGLRRRTAGSTSSTARPTPEEQHVSRFTLAADGTIDMASEKVLLRIPHQRVICCHSVRLARVRARRQPLHLHRRRHGARRVQRLRPARRPRCTTSRATNPDANHAYDARRTSGNTNDLRGKILRITPQDDGDRTGPGRATCSTSAASSRRRGKTRPEIYTMGHRNPFRIHVDQETGWLYNGEVGPDANDDNADRGPRGYDELNQIRQAGNMGWPYCIANNKAYVDWDFAEPPVRAPFDCAAAAASTTARQRLRLEHRPGADAAGEPALLCWPYGALAPDFPGHDIPIPARAARRSPARRTTTTQPTRRRRSSRRGTTTRCSSRTGRATGSRR